LDFGKFWNWLRKEKREEAKKRIRRRMLGFEDEPELSYRIPILPSDMRNSVANVGSSVIPKTHEDPKNLLEICWYFLLFWFFNLYWSFRHQTK
jgi:hypothetical protein